MAGKTIYGFMLGLCWIEKEREPQITQIDTDSAKIEKVKEEDNNKEGAE